MGKAKVKAGPPNLADKKDLLLHTYDSFLVSQTRIFTLAYYVYQHQSMEIETRQKLLFLDDLLNFAITARRLIELTGLRSFSNARAVGLYCWDRRETPIEISKLKNTNVGFLTVINSIIHCRYIELITNKFQTGTQRLVNDNDLLHYYQTFEKICGEQRWHEYSVGPAIVVVPDKAEPFMTLLKDIVSASNDVSEKIVDVCTDSKIFLELEYRSG
jgi:hypothetical protein